MTPWGSRLLRATAYSRRLPRLDFELDLEPDSRQVAAAAPGQAAGVPTRNFSLKVVNRLPFDLTDCWLLIGITEKSTVAANSRKPGNANFAGAPAGAGQGSAGPEEDLVDVYCVKPLGGMASGASYDHFVAADFRERSYNFQSTIRIDPRRHIPHPTISRLGTASAWIIGAIKNSPIMQIDAEHSDFNPQESTHLFIQEILPEDMPEASLFLGPNPPPAN
jgi:hypothetical protein